MQTGTTFRSGFFSSAVKRNSLCLQQKDNLPPVCVCHHFRHTVKSLFFDETCINHHLRGHEARYGKLSYEPAVKDGSRPGEMSTNEVLAGTSRKQG
jgi:hypothetical protein